MDEAMDILFAFGAVQSSAKKRRITFGILSIAEALLPCTIFAGQIAGFVGTVPHRRKVACRTAGSIG